MKVLRKLYRSQTDRKLAGVLGGIAEYTGIDSSLLRILFVLGILFSVGSLPLIYLVWIFVVPNEEVK